MMRLQRHFHERLLGGVCGGLAARFWGPVAYWRALFVLLCPLTFGAAAFVYLALWYGLPLAPTTPTVPKNAGRPLRRGLLIALAGGALLACVTLWRVADWPPWDAALLGALLGGVLISLSELRPRGALALPLLLLALLLSLLAWRSGALSPGVADLLERAAPAPLLLLGLRALLRGGRPGRIRGALANAGALVGSGALCAAIALLAFARFDARLGENTQEQVRLTRALPPDLRLLRVELSALASDIIVERSLTPLAQVSGSYRASANLRLTQTCNGEICAEEGQLSARPDGTADLGIRAEKVAAFPPLLARGHGELRLQLPGDVPLDLLLRGGDGEATLSLHGLQLERLNLELARGNALVSLPLYAPLGTARGEAQGTLRLAGGDLILRLPAGLAARFTLIAAEAVDYPATHFAREGDALVSIVAMATGAWSAYRLNVPAGEIRLLIAAP